MGKTDFKPDFIHGLMFENYYGANAVPMVAQQLGDIIAIGLNPFSPSDTALIPGYTPTDETWHDLFMKAVDSGGLGLTGDDLNGKTVFVVPCSPEPSDHWLDLSQSAPVIGWDLINSTAFNQDEHTCGVRYQMRSTVFLFNGDAPIGTSSLRCFVEVKNVDFVRVGGECTYTQSSLIIENDEEYKWYEFQTSPTVETFKVLAPGL